MKNRIIDICIVVIALILVAIQYTMKLPTYEFQDWILLLTTIAGEIAMAITEQVEWLIRIWFGSITIVILIGIVLEVLT